jgi:redox-sensitive bicupin YhaK (pirin superfamily)
MSGAKRLIEVRAAGEPQMVGDGFRVRNVFSYRGDAVGRADPFLHFDYGAPVALPPTDAPLGVGEHPHKGFETVTVVWQGEVEHRDSSGGSGKIGPGDVQWMTAGAGLVHEEMLGRDWLRRGGTLEFAQLWVNLPARDKAAAPGYQTLPAADIPTVALPGGAGTARVIAGKLFGARGPARTFTPVGVWDVRLESGATVELPVPDGHTALVFARSGAAAVGEEAARVNEGEVATFGRAGNAVPVASEAGASLLVLTGEPVAEPVAAYGPFVLNTAEEIRQAVADFRAGKMGRLT